MNTTAMKDQLQAAYRDTRRITHILGEYHGITPQQLRIPEWVREQFENIGAGIENGTTRTCRHLGSPQPVFAAVWKPDLITCGRCADRIDPKGMEDNTCDRCRRVVIPIVASLASKGALTLQFGLCRRCADEVGVPRQGRRR